MSARPSDWYPVGWPCDPVPGDPAAVGRAARTYRQTAEAVGTAITNLDRLDAGNMHGQAIVAVLDQIKSVRDSLDKVESRVAGAASALEVYEPALTSAQAESLAALHDAEALKAEEQRAVAAANHARDTFNGSNDPEQKTAAANDYRRAKDDAGSAASGLAAARARIATAISERDAAASTAINLLDEIDASSPIRDSVWDKITDWCGKAADWIDEHLKPILEAVQKVLDLASIVCLVAATVLAVTGVGAPVAAALFAASRVMATASVILGGVLTLGLGLLKAVGGRQSWGDFLVASAGFALTVAVKKFVKLKLKPGDRVLDGIGKVAMSKKDTVIRAAARWACNHEFALTPLIKKGVGYVEHVAMDGAKAAATWTYENVIKPVVNPSQVPHQQYRRESCGGSAGAGFVGGGGGGGGVGAW